MISFLTDSFKKRFYNLPERVQDKARKINKVWKEDPFQPNLQFKRIHKKRNIYSVQIGESWRAVGEKEAPQKIVWFWVGTHSDYDKLLDQLK